MKIGYCAGVCSALLLGCAPRPEPVLVLGSERIEVSFDQREPVSVRVRADEAWRVESSEAWCRVEARNDSTFLIQVDPYPGATKRQTKVLVSTAHLQAQLLVVQGTVPGGDFLRHRDSLALEAIYRAGGGDQWTWRVGFEETKNEWNRAKPITQWQGVTTQTIEGSVRVRILDLRPIEGWSGALADSAGLLNKLSGVYLGPLPLTASPLETLSKLDTVEVLDISFAPYSLVWPTEMGGLKHLSLLYALGVAHPSNRLDPRWRELTRLQAVELAGGGLEGGFPQVLLNNTSLEWIDLSDNPQMGGALPPQIAQLTALEYLDVSICGLTGSLPDELGRLSHLTILKAASNPELGGSVPASLGAIKNLQTLTLGDCAFTKLPIEVWNCAHLRYVDVAFNQIEGSIPAAVASMQFLEFLGLTHNRLSGEIPAKVLSCAGWKTWNPSSWICPQQTGYGFTNCTQ